MFELLILIVFVGLFSKAIGLACKVTWGLAKVVAMILFALALPSLVGCLLIAGGIASLLPIALVGVACGILKTCV